MLTQLALPLSICLARVVVVVAVVVYQVKALVTNVTRELLANDSSPFQTQATCRAQPSAGCRAASPDPRDEIEFVCQTKVTQFTCNAKNQQN